jgi:LacI family transcriptional regulator
MTTIRDIASVAGVNPSTVSKALRGSSDINPETAENIRNIAAGLGYNMEKLRKATPDTKTIGVVFPELGSQYYCGIFDSFRFSMKKEGYRVITMLTDFDPVEEQESSIRYLTACRVSGILYLTESIFHPERIKPLFEKSPAKAVMITMMSGIDFCDVISVNHSLGVRIAINHLYKLGHRRIAFIGEENTVIRQIAFHESMSEFGIALEPRNIIVNKSRFEECGYLAMKELLEQPPEERPTACFAAYDDIAYGAIKALDEAGLTVPEDMSIIGVDNKKISHYMHVPLSSIDTPVEEVGSVAAKFLLRRIKGDNSPLQTILFSPKLCLRSSTAPVAVSVEE